MIQKTPEQSTPIIGFAGFSGSGKTTLLTKIIPLLTTRGLRVAVIKHTHHNFDIDIPGKDSYAVRQAGAQQVLVASNYRWALITETPAQAQDPSLRQLLDRLDHNAIDIVLVEGFKHEAHPKIEVQRGDQQRDYLYPNDNTVIAIATDQAQPLQTRLPQLDINNPAEICDFICAVLSEYTATYST